MKKLFTLLSLPLILLASLSQEVDDSFSIENREELLKELNSSSYTMHKTDTYILNKGWNLLNTPSTGVEVQSTFDISIVKFVAVYDNKSLSWALYSPENMIQNNKILLLKYLEPNISFFVFAKERKIIKIKSNKVNDTCKKFILNDDYSYMIHGARELYSASNDKKNIIFNSRYFSHQERGIYDDTRVMLIYPVVESKGKPTYKYGPAKPKINILYAKEYENKKFYTYDYKLQKCFMGYFPSMKIPPYPVLEEI